MTKQDSFQIGAHSKRPFDSHKKPQSRSNVTGSFHKNPQNRQSSQSQPRNNSSQSQPRNNSFQSQPRNHSRSNQQRSFNNKSRPINKQSNFKPRNSQRGPPNHRDQRDNRNNNSSRPDKFQRNRNDHKQSNNYVKNEDRNYKKQEPKPPVDPAVILAEIKKQKQRKIKHNRIIVRNLVFDVSESHIRKLLSPFGEIVDIHIPQNPDKKGSRGFAFVEFANRNFALKAIKDLNGTTYKGRQIVLDESVSKERYLESKVNQEQNEKNTEQTKNEDNSKIKLQQSKVQKIEEEQQNDDEQNDQVDEEEQENQDDQEQEQESEKPKKQYTGKKEKNQQQILEDISSEVFIRNLPISVSEKTVHQFFRRYGQLKFAKIVINKETGLSKGSAFLKFEDPFKAKELVEYSRDYEMSLLGKNPNFKINPAINLQLEGTILKLFPVESRDNIKVKVQGRQEKDKAREEKKKEEEKKKKPIKKIKSLQKLVAYDPNDKRHLKLALLGINKATEEMTERDQERFRNHERQKLQKLKNPNNSVSDRRIIIKLLNKDITEQDIKNLCNSYLTQNKHKLNNLTYCKLMLESLQTKKSAGFAFVEFRTHEISIGFLEWIVQEHTQLMKQPFVCEFAIQDSRKMAKIQSRNKPVQNKPVQNKTHTNRKQKNKK